MEDILLIAEAVLGISAERLVPATRIGVAASALAAPFAVDDRGHDHYPTLAHKAAILCSRLVRNHPLPDGNKRVAFVAMLELLARNGARFASSDGGEELAEAIERLAARELAEAAFATWVAERVARAPRNPSS